MEGLNKTYKHESHYLKAPATVDEGIALTADFVQRYNKQRLHSAIDYVSPKDKLCGLEKEILEAREMKLIAACELRRLYRLSLTDTNTHTDVQAIA